MTRGKFITFEGIDGAGKTSHISWVTAHLQILGHTIVQTREPGGTPLGEKLRDIILNDSMQPATEALLVFAARQEHVLQVIEPALSKGYWVLSDRFTDATFAYQGYGRGFDLNDLAQLEQWVQRGLQPDLTLVFDCPEAVAAQRLAKAREADKFERESQAFFKRVREGYLARAKAQAGRFLIIDSSQPPDHVRQALQLALATRLQAWQSLGSAL
jgi:dTMP kinase